MHLEDTPEEATLRAGLREWLAVNERPDTTQTAHHEPTGADDVEAWRDWSRRLYEAGFVGTTWPTQYGGQEAPLTHQMIALEEFARSGAPEHLNVIGVWMAAPTILAHGSDDQKSRFVRRTATAEDIWCQGFSEPGAGSDLASLSTRAERRAGGYVINGQKVWSSFAHIADYCILLARTDPTAPKHKGLTYLIVDMRAPGVEVRPLRQLNGDIEFNEIFFSDVHVPGENVVGGEGNGWRVAITTLMNERVNLGVVFAARLELALQRLLRLASKTPQNGAHAIDDPLIRDRIAQLWIDSKALQFTSYRAMSEFQVTGHPGPEGSVIKLMSSDAYGRLTKLALEIEGAHALISGGEHAIDDGMWQHLQLRSRGNTIEGGTSEILRSIVAERVLRLPKSR